MDVDSCQGKEMGDHPLWGAPKVPALSVVFIDPFLDPLISITLISISRYCYFRFKDGDIKIQRCRIPWTGGGDPVSSHRAEV